MTYWFAGWVSNRPVELAREQGFVLRWRDEMISIDLGSGEPRNEAVAGGKRIKWLWPRQGKSGDEYWERCLTDKLQYQQLRSTAMSDAAVKSKAVGF